MDFIMTFVDWLTSHFDLIMGAVFAVIAAASAVAALTPTQVDDNWVAKVKKWADWLALNVGNAKKPAVSDDQK